MLFGLSTIMFSNNKNICRHHIDLINESGFKFIELLSFQELSSDSIDYLKQLEIKVLSIHADYLDTDISSNDYFYRNKSIKNIMASIDYAHYAGAGLVVVHPGAYSPDMGTRQKKLKNCINSIVEIRDYAEALEIRIAIENLPPGFLCDNAAEIRHVLDSVNEKSLKENKTKNRKDVGICLDTGHANLKNNLRDILNEFNEDILTIHAHDNFGDKGGDRSIGVDDLHLFPYEGNICWDSFFRTIQNMQYNNALIFEIIPENGFEKDELIKLQELSRAF